MEHYCHSDPDLPVRERSGNSEFSSNADIRSEPPESEHLRHERGWNEQSAQSQSHMPIFSGCPPARTALRKTASGDHNLSSFQLNRKPRGSTAPERASFRMPRKCFIPCKHLTGESDRVKSQYGGV